MCGSCWAFGTLGTLEMAIAVYDGDHVDLSEQHIVDCNRDGSSCGGGYWAYETIMEDTGAAWESDYPYRARDGRCSVDGLERPYHIKSWGSVPAHDLDAIKSAIYEYGSVAVTMASCGSIPGYTGGVYDSTECNRTSTNHIVTLVGWDDSISHRQGSGVWVLRNSWGTGWGDGGYMLAAYGVARIAEDVTYSEYEALDPTDTDEDGVIDLRDNCPEAVNPGQIDSDLDGSGDACDSVFDVVERDMSLSDDDSRVLSLGFDFPFFGQTYSEVHVNSDGNLTFGEGDAQTSARDESRFLTGAPRIAFFYSDLNPGGGGSVTYLKEDEQTLTIRYQGVPEYSSSGGGGANSVEVTLHSSGRITINVSASTLSGSDPKCVIGISRGGAGNSATEVDLSSIGDGIIAYEGQNAVFETFSGGESFDLSGQPISFSPTGEPNRPPTVDIEADPRTGDAPLEVQFRAIAADEDGTIASYHWDFGDRTVSEEQDPLKVFEFEGDYTVTLTVTDNSGEAATATTLVAVGHDLPPDDGDDDGGPDDGDDDADGGPDGPSGGDEPLNGMVGIGGCSAAGPNAPAASRWPAALLVGLALFAARRR